MANKLNFVAIMAGLDAVDADGISIGGVAGSTSDKKAKRSEITKQELPHTATHRKKSCIGKLV